MFGIVFALDFHAVEHAVVLILDVGGKDHFAVAGDFEVHILLGVVHEGEAAYLCRAVFEHGDFRLGFDAVVHTHIDNLVASEADVVVFGHHIERRVGGRPQFVVAQIAYVEVYAIMVGTDFTVSVEHHIAVARETAAAVVEQYGVLAVAYGADFGYIGDGVEVARIALGLHLGVLVAFVLCDFQVDIRLDLGFLFQQGLHRTHGRLLHEVTLQAVVGKIVGEAGKYHALVVGVVGLDRHMVFLVVALEETHVVVVHAQVFESLHVFIYGTVVHLDGHQ